MIDKTDAGDTAATPSATPPDPAPNPDKDAVRAGPKQKAGEIGGPPGPEPTRYGDWELKGRCTDF